MKLPENKSCVTLLLDEIEKITCEVDGRIISAMIRDLNNKPQTFGSMMPKSGKRVVHIYYRK